MANLRENWRGLRSVKMDVKECENGVRGLGNELCLLNNWVTLNWPFR